MDPLGMTLGLLIALILIAAAAYFAKTQWHILKTLDAKLPVDQRRYLLTQCWRRLFGSVVMMLLAALLVGSVFLDYDPLAGRAGELEIDREAAKPAVRFLSFHLMSMMLLLMVILALAVFDFWATARHGVRQQKQLFLEHQEMLAAELEEHRHRQSEMN